MEPGELALRWTVRVSMLLYAVSLLLSAHSEPGRSRQMVSRAFWTAGCLAYLAHVFCAFEFVHAWSHAAAYASTARQTEAVVGINWGGGLYANYLFTAIWLGDVCWWWVGIEQYRERSSWLAWGTRGYLAFIGFNATVIFATGPVRWAGIAACVVLAAMLWVNRTRSASG